VGPGRLAERRERKINGLKTLSSRRPMRKEEEFCELRDIVFSRVADGKRVEKRIKIRKEYYKVKIKV
jgi:hypothetical protein